MKQFILVNFLVTLFSWQAFASIEFQMDGIEGLKPKYKPVTVKFQSIANPAVKGSYKHSMILGDDDQRAPVLRINDIILAGLEMSFGELQELIRRGETNCKTQVSVRVQQAIPEFKSPENVLIVKQMSILVTENSSRCDQ